MGSRHCPKHLICIVLLNLHKQLCEIGAIIFSFTAKDTEVQSGKVTCMSSHSWQMIKPGFEIRQLTSHPHNNQIEVPEAQGVYGTCTTELLSQGLD